MKTKEEILAAHKYCYHCGGYMVAREIAVGFNEKTGKEIYHYLVECQKNNVWNFWVVHQKFELDEFGDWVDNRYV